MPSFEGLFRRGWHIRAAILEEAYRSRAARLRLEAVEACNARRRSLLFYAACECDAVADGIAEAARARRIQRTQSRCSDRRRRLTRLSRTYRGRTPETRFPPT